MAVDVIVLKRDGFHYAGKRVFCGEIFPLLGYPNDQKMIDVRYVERYSDSMHDRNDETEAFGRRFISYNARVQAQQTLEEEAVEAAAKVEAFKVDQTQLEYTTIESMGMKVHEQRGPHQVSLAHLPDTAECPLCGESMPPTLLREHVSNHEADPAHPSETEPEESTAPAATAVATKPARARSTRPARASRKAS